MSYVLLADKTGHAGASASVTCFYDCLSIPCVTRFVGLESLFLCWRHDIILPRENYQETVGGHTSFLAKGGERYGDSE